MRVMRRLVVAVVVTVVVLPQFINAVDASGATFEAHNCYVDGLDKLDERMPNSLGNLVALIETLERKHTYISPHKVAEAIIKRYRQDGYRFYQPQYSTAGRWGPNELYEMKKQRILSAVLNATERVPENTYQPREECSLHFLVSHSTDLYPHINADQIWNDQTRYRRQAEPRFGSGLPSNEPLAEHPIENGVIYTRYGPVAAGTLLAGIMVKNQAPVSIRHILGKVAAAYMPYEMQRAQINPLYASTLSGDIGQAVLIRNHDQTTTNPNIVGPSGLFGNSSAAPKLFTHKQNYGHTPIYLTRAEIFAGIDALLIQKFLTTSSSSSQMRLSDLLKMYYSEHGLPGYPQYRACNRMEAYQDLDSTQIKNQALHFMYIYADKIPGLKDLVNEARGDFSRLERKFRSALNPTWNGFKNFIDHYSYEDYDQCPTLNTKEVPCENQVDLLMIYSSSRSDEQRKYLSHLSQMVGVGLDRSRVGVMRGSSGQWLVPMTNFTNVADWGSNFTEDDSIYESGSQNPAKVLEALTSYYTEFYEHLHSDSNNASAHSQVVLWNIPGSIRDPETFLDHFQTFNQTFPDVRFLLVGTTKSGFEHIMYDPQADFFSFNTIQRDMEKLAAQIAAHICQIPSMFVYPSCDPNNGNETSHIYEGYISPNYTTYIKISPQNFRYASNLKLKVGGNDVHVCSSRMDPLVQDTAGDYMCATNSEELEFWHLCNSSINECHPIYLSVSGTAQSNQYCNDDRCQFPNQIKYQLTHEGMTCGMPCLAPCGTCGVAASITVTLFFLALLGFARKAMCSCSTKLT